MTPENFQFGIDLVVILISVGIIILAIKAAVGGLFGRGMTQIAAGILVLAINHALDTLFFQSTLMMAGHTADFLQPSIVHRLINLVGFFLIFLGFFSFSKTKS